MGATESTSLGRCCARFGGADHIFSVFDPSKQLAARLMKITLAWYERTL
jgi:hypothetical protein